MAERDVWPRCYRTRWHKLDVHPDTFAHPAKFQPRLIRSIYAHALTEGWLKAGDTVLDPFAGVGLGAFYALQAGLHWIGVELEPHHAATGQANIALWKRRYATMPNLGDAVLLQGDSRKLGHLKLDRQGVRGFESQLRPLPRFRSRGTPWPADAEFHSIDGLVGSPPYNLPMSQDHPGRSGGKRGIDASEPGAFVKYGNTPGQLEGMREGSLDAAIGSPPYAEGLGHGGGSCPIPHDTKGTAQAMRDGYGSHPANLASLPEGSFAAAVGSPPYESQDVCHLKGDFGGTRKKTGVGGHGHQTDGYGESPSNLGNQSGDTFWASARVILDNCYRLIRPGGHAIWVVGPYVRKGKLVDFPDQWRQVCEAAGFRSLHVHRCPKVETYGTQRHLDGGESTKTIHRTSFFRTLANRRNGSARVLYEDVLCTERP